MRVPVRRSAFIERNRRLRVPGVRALPFRLAYGNSLTRLPTEFQVRRQAADGRPRIIAVDPTRGLTAQLWPRYRATVRLGAERFIVRTAGTDREIASARALLGDTHPEGAANQGMYICLHSIDEEEEGQEALVAVAQIGEYYHTHFPGRAAFGRRLFGSSYSSLGRAQVIQGLPLAAGKRFAVRAERQGEGIGELLARQTLIVAQDYRWPPARVVEVSRYMTETDYYEVCCNRRGDFLTRSGYVPVPPERWLRRGRINDALADELTHRRIAGYYYADLSGRSRSRAIENALAASP